MRFFSKRINPRSLGSWCVKGTDESTLDMDSSVLLMHHDPTDLGLICLLKKRKIRFRSYPDLRIQSWISLKKRTLINQFKSMSSRRGLHSFMAVKTRHQRPLHLVQPQVQQLSQEIELKGSSRCQPTACPLVKTKKTFSSLTELIHKPFCRQGISVQGCSFTFKINMNK